MEKNRWSLIFIGLCLIFAFSMSPVEAKAEKGPRCTDEIDNDGDDMIDCGGGVIGGVLFAADPDCNCGGEDPSSGEVYVPRMARVDNNFGDRTAPAFIMEAAGGIYTKISVRNFNKWDADQLRQRADVLHFAYSSPRSIDLDWRKLLDFMNTDRPDDCGTSPPCIGGGILIEDPANVEDIKLDVGIIGTQLHTPGNEPTIVDFVDTAPAALSAFTKEQTPGQLNNSDFFQDGTLDTDDAPGNCADDSDDPPRFHWPEARPRVRLLGQ